MPHHLITPEVIISKNKKDQFMLNDSSMTPMQSTGEYLNAPPHDMQKLFSYMKNVMSNPLLMDQMEKFLSAKQAEKNSSFINPCNHDSMSMSMMEMEMKQPPDFYIIETTNSKRPEPLRMTPNQNVKKIKSPETNTICKKGSNMQSPNLEKENAQNEKYFQANNFEIDNFNNRFQQKVQEKSRINEEKNTKVSSKSTVSFEDMPIKSNYIANQQLNNYNLDSEMLASYPENQSEIYNNPPNQKQKKPSTLNVNEITKTSNKYIEVEQKPINEARNDFKQLLEKKCAESPFDQRPLPTLANNSSHQNWENEYENENGNQETENHDNQKPKRQFLKRGSRQYLSSAKDRKSAIKPSQQVKNKDIQETLNNSRFGADKQKDKTPTKRDVSQNRILSKRNTINNDKSVTKLKQNLNDSKQESFYEQKDEATKRSTTQKNQKLGAHSKSPVLPPKNNKPANNFGKTDKSSLGNQGSGKKKNVFDDSSSSDQDQHQDRQNSQGYQSSRTNNFIDSKKQKMENDKKLNSYQPDREFNMFSRQKKQEVIQGVFLTKSQLETILEKYTPKQIPSSKNLNSNEEKFNELRKKYTDLCNLLQKQKIEHEQTMEKEKEEFQNYKQQEMQKIKNERRVMERQVKSSMPSQSQNLQKDKQEVENLKKQLEKQRDEHKKKEKNNKILIEKYKKENEELKYKLERLQEEIQNKSSGSFAQKNFCSTVSDKQTNSNTSNSRASIMNDKSKSKSTTKDLSPGKGKIGKTSKKIEQNEEQDAMNDKSYKKTVPLYKAKQQKSVSTNQKKVQDFKNYEENQNSDDQNLPTFKVDNKKIDESKTKMQKKYQYVQNSDQLPKINKKQNEANQSKKNLNHQNKANLKNVFDDDSDEQNSNQDNSQNEGEFDNQEDDARFFKKQQKYESLSDLINNNFSIKCVNAELTEKLFRYQNNVEYRKYISRVNNPKRIIVNSSKNGVDKKITNIYSDKSKQILFQNGVKKEIFEDGYTIIYFKNGDIKQKLTDGTILYYFKEKIVDQITLINGLNIYRFENNQVELHFDGGKYIQIIHPDGTIKILGSPVY